MQHHIKVGGLLILGLFVFSNSFMGASIKEGQPQHFDGEAYQNRTTTTNPPTSLARKCQTLPSPGTIDLASKATLMHVGKAGGGTIFRNRLPVWNISMPRCHPKPCHNTKENGLFLINVRDPIDRFVSAFYYTHSRFCHPDPNQEARQRINIGGTQPQQRLETLIHHHGTQRRLVVVDQNSETTCLAGDPASHVYYVTYQQNVNGLAEALCNDSRSTSLQAKRSLPLIHHMHTNLDKWMKFFYRHKENKDNIFPIVVMPQVDSTHSNNNNTTLEQQTDQAIVWLYEQLNFEPPEDFEARQRAAQCVVDNEATFQHASHSHNYPPLSRQGMLCLAQFYAKDYRWLERIGNELCKTHACKEAIQTILRRRVPLLAQTKLMQNQT